jgi:hypothetical protein
VGFFGGATLYALFPDTLQKLADPWTFKIASALFGAACQRGIEKVVLFMLPIGSRYISRYETLRQLNSDFRRGFITPDEYRDLRQKLNEQHFLGHISERGKLPP